MVRFWNVGRDIVVAVAAGNFGLLAGTHAHDVWISESSSVPVSSFCLLYVTVVLLPVEKTHSLLARCGDTVYSNDVYHFLYLGKPRLWRINGFSSPMSVASKVACADTKKIAFSWRRCDFPP